VCVVYDQQQHACAITTASAIAGTTVAAGTAAEEKVQLRKEHLSSLRTQLQQRQLLSGRATGRVDLEGTIKSGGTTIVGSKMTAESESAKKQQKEWQRERERERDRDTERTKKSSLAGR